MLAFLGTPDPIAFTIFGREIRWYAIMLATGILLGFYVLIKRGVRAGYKEDDLYDLFLVMIPMGIVGARLYYVLFYDLKYYLSNPSEIIAIWKGGLAIHGAIILGLAGIILVVRKKKWNLLDITDLTVPCVALGQAIGRWGNYFNMEAHGVETDLPWAITVLEGGKYINVHPTFLYESIWDLCVFLVLVLIISKRSTRYGQTTCWYFILYSIGRFFIEGLRTDSLMFLGLRQAQLISIALIIIGIAGLMIIKKTPKLKKEKKTDTSASEESPEKETVTAEDDSTEKNTAEVTAGEQKADA